MMNRNERTASTLNDETMLDAYLTLTEGGNNFGLGLAFASTLNSHKNRRTPIRMDEDMMDAYLTVSEGSSNPGMGLAVLMAL